MCDIMAPKVFFLRNFTNNPPSLLVCSISIGKFAINLIMSSLIFCVLVLYSNLSRCGLFHLFCLTLYLINKDIHPLSFNSLKFCHFFQTFSLIPLKKIFFYYSGYVITLPLLLLIPISINISFIFSILPFLTACYSFIFQL